jgi:hypothetical protein
MESAEPVDHGIGALWARQEMDMIRNTNRFSLLIFAPATTPQITYKANGRLFRCLSMCVNKESERHHVVAQI